MGVAKKMLAKCKSQELSIQKLLLEYRNCSVLNSPYSPAELLFSRKTRSDLPCHDNLLKPKLVLDWHKYQKGTDERNKKCYDKSAKVSSHQFQVGDRVIYFKDKKWLPAVIVRCHESPRLENNLLFLDSRIIVPVSLRPEVFKKVHSSHFGLSKTKARAKSLFYWQRANKIYK